MDRIHRHTELAPVFAPAPQRRPASALLEAAELAVARGRAANTSAWVNDALPLKLAQERRLEALAAFVAAYERTHEAISADEIKQATRRARAHAIVVRGKPAGRLRPDSPRPPRQ